MGRVNFDDFSTKYIEKRKKIDKDFELNLKKAELELNIAIIVKNLRQDLKLSQREFAKKINKPQSTIARIENGTMSPTIGLLQDIASLTDKKLKIEFVNA